MSNRSSSILEHLAEEDRKQHLETLHEMLRIVRDQHFPRWQPDEKASADRKQAHIETINMIVGDGFRSTTEHETQIAVTNLGRIRDDLDAFWEPDCLSNDMVKADLMVQLGRLIGDDPRPAADQEPKTDRSDAPTGMQM